MQWQVVSLLCWLNCFYPLFLSSCKTRLMPLLRCRLYYLSVNCLFFHIRPNLLPSDAFLLLFVVSDSEYETKQTRQTLEMILWYAYFFEQRKRKYWVQPIQSWKQDAGKESFTCWWRSCGIIPVTSRYVSGCQWSRLMHCSLHWNNMLKGRPPISAN